MAEFTKGMIEEEEKAVRVVITSAIVVLPWEIYTNGAANRKGVGISVVLITPEKLIMKKSLRLGFLATNNEAKYKALLARLNMVIHLRGDMVEVYSDS